MTFNDEDRDDRFIKQSQAYTLVYKSYEMFFCVHRVLSIWPQMIYEKCANLQTKENWNET